MNITVLYSHKSNNYRVNKKYYSPKTWMKKKIEIYA